MRLDELGCKRASYRVSTVTDSATVQVLDAEGLPYAAHGFEVGDPVIVAAPKAHGVVGPGGTWPSASYATEAELLADTDPVGSGKLPANPLNSSIAVPAYAQDTLRVWGWAWSPAPPPTYTWWRDATAYWFYSNVVALALRTTVQSVNGAELTLADVAQATLTTTIHYDCASAINAWTQAPTTGELIIPRGAWALGTEILAAASMSDVVIRGDTFTGRPGRGGGSAPARPASELYSPWGCRSATITTNLGANVTFSDFRLRGNGLREGYWHGREEFYFQGGLPRGLHIQRGTDFRVHNVRISDTMNASLAINAGSGHRITHVHSNRAQTLRYAWDFANANTDGVVYEDCRVAGRQFVWGMEPAASDCVFRRCIGVNAVIAQNGASDFLFEDCSFSFAPDILPEVVGDAGELVGDFAAALATRTLCNHNSQFGPVSGGTFRRCTWTVNGKADGATAYGKVFSSSSADVGGDPLVMQDCTIQANGHATDAVVLEFATLQPMQVSGLTADAEVRVYAGSVSGSSGPLLRYRSGTTTLGAGNTFDQEIDLDA